LEKSDGGANIRTVNVGSVRPSGDSLDARLDRIEKLLETINLRLAAMAPPPVYGGRPGLGNV
jgi:hypothetical protein